MYVSRQTCVWPACKQADVGIREGCCGTVGKPTGANPASSRRGVGCHSRVRGRSWLRRHKLETSLSQLTYSLDKGDYAGSAAIDSRGAALLTATRCCCRSLGCSTAVAVMDMQ